MKLPVEEFLRRYVQHILPRYFIKTRHYGIFGTRVKKEKLRLIRKSLKQKEPEVSLRLTVHEVHLKTTGIDLQVCTTCRKGRMVVLEITHPPRGSPRKLSPHKTIKS